LVASCKRQTNGKLQLHFREWGDSFEKCRAKPYRLGSARLDGVWYRHKAVSLRREIIGVARCEFQVVIFRNCGLQCIRHLPAILPPQRSCQIRYSTVNDQGRKSIQQTAGELPFFTLEAREDLRACNYRDRKLSLHFQKILSRCGYPIEMVDHDHGIDEDGRNYFCHSFRKWR